MHKFPRTFNRKWKRYSKIEKIFIIYLFVLLWLEFFLPFISIEDVSYPLINTHFPLTSIIAICTLVFIIFWNSSYTVKWAVKQIFWFEYNEAILNFWVLFLHASFLIYSKEFVSIIALWKSFDFYKLTYWFYLLWWLLVVWLIWNLFVALNLSFFNKKRINYTKVISTSNYQDDSEEKKIKSLFDK